MKKYVHLWIIIALVIGCEYYSLNYRPQWSILLTLQARGVIDSNLKLNTEPGRPLSLWLGWLGFSLMVIMNVYSFRKRLNFMSMYGKLSSWLNFHIFCGLLGPTMIFFHCNFKVRGIVGISFWSMVISFSSGIIGRYFYVQLLRLKQDYVKSFESRREKLDQLLDQAKTPITPEARLACLERVESFVGIPANSISVNPFKALGYSLWGDLKLMISQPDIPRNWPAGTRGLIIGYALNKRKSLFLEPFQRLMGYWHAFHFPFAVFMYITAVIHIVSALIFLKT